MKDFNDLVAVVTGGARGIGAVTALDFAKRGATVVLFDKNENKLQETISRVRTLGGNGIAICLDITDRDQVEKAMDQVINVYGKIDILVNNAGILKDNMIDHMTDEEWNIVMDVNLKGSFLCTQAAQKHMKKQKYGKIIMVSSQAATGSRGRANYSAAKAGIQGLTKALSIELGSFGINVNAVAPGFIETEMSKVSEQAAKKRGIKNFQEVKASFIRNNPIQRVGQPEDVANVIIFLASDLADYVTGQIIYVSGNPVI